MSRPVTKRRINCLSCKETRHHQARGLCRPCYNRHKAAGTLDQYPRTNAACTDPQCRYVAPNGERCTRTRRRRRTGGKFCSPYCHSHYRRILTGLDVDKPIRAIDNSGETRCAHRYPDGRRCPNPRCVRRNGTFQGVYCSLHRNRYHQGLNMDADLHLPGERSRLTIT